MSQRADMYPAASLAMTHRIPHALPVSSRCEATHPWGGLTRVKCLAQERRGGGRGRLGGGFHWRLNTGVHGGGRIGRLIGFILTGVLGLHAFSAVGGEEGASEPDERASRAMRAMHAEGEPWPSRIATEFDRRRTKK